MSEEKGLIYRLRQYALQMRSTVHIQHTGADLVDEAADVLEQGAKIIVDGIRLGLIPSPESLRPEVADRERLDWLQKTCFMFDEKHNDSWFDADQGRALMDAYEGDLRAAIDRARSAHLPQGEKG